MKASISEIIHLFTRNKRISFEELQKQYDPNESISPIISELLLQKYVFAHWEKSNGSQHKFFYLTQKGRKNLISIQA